MLVFGCVGNQSDLIKVVQPERPTTVLAAFPLFQVSSIVISRARAERKMDGRMKGRRDEQIQKGKAPVREERGRRAADSGTVGSTDKRKGCGGLVFTGH